jgi:hypothetical protein
MTHRVRRRRLGCFEGARRPRPAEQSFIPTQTRNYQPTMLDEQISAKTLEAKTQCNTGCIYKEARSGLV